MGVHNRGLMLIGRYVGRGPIFYGAKHPRHGEAVEGLERLSVDIVADGVGSSVERDVSYNTADRDTGDQTDVAAELDRLALQPGEVVACKVRPRSSPGGYVNLDLIQIARVTAEQTLSQDGPAKPRRSAA